MIGKLNEISTNTSDQPAGEWSVWPYEIFWRDDNICVEFFEFVEDFRFTSSKDNIVTVGEHQDQVFVVLVFLQSVSKEIQLVTTCGEKRRKFVLIMSRA